jgi:hypothetical protein
MPTKTRLAKLNAQQNRIDTLNTAFASGYGSSHHRNISSFPSLM